MGIETHRNVQFECQCDQRGDGQEGDQDWRWWVTVLHEKAPTMREGRARSEGFAYGAALEAGRKMIDELYAAGTIS